MPLKKSLEFIVLGIVVSAMIVLVSFLFSSCEPAWGEPLFNDENCIRACMGEARGEGFQGLLAVSCALRNRGTLKGVYGFNAKFKEPEYVWNMARKAWKESKYKDVTNGATHWESTNFKVPYWAKDMSVSYRYKKHIFYK